jgi:Ca2+-binding RTX toxin-like protein
MAYDIYGTNYSEITDGTSYADNIFGLAGNDDLYGYEGSDWLDGGRGDDILYGGSGSDLLIGGTGQNELWGGSGYDDFIVSVRGASGWSDDLIADFEFDIDAVDLSDWGVSDFSQIKALLQTDSSGNATLNAYFAGYDHVVTFDGIARSELAASDFLYSNSGSLDLGGTSYDDVLFGSRSADRLSGFAGSDILLGGYGSDLLYGDGGTDRLVGGFDSDRLYGGAGSDLLQGDSGHDLLVGAAGRDFLEGGSGNDVLNGGRGTDDLTGGTGADRFVFDDADFGGLSTSTADLITDFHRSEGDRIDLSRTDAVAGGNDNAFFFIGSAQFSGVAGELRATQSGGQTFISGDVDGDAAADFLIVLNGAQTLVESDFAL